MGEAPYGSMARLDEKFPQISVRLHPPSPMASFFKLLWVCLSATKIFSKQGLQDDLYGYGIYIALK